MEFRELKTFQIVASLSSFNKAARVLHLAQSTVSAQIRSLENSLGKPLFHRSGKMISLTTAGTELLNYTQRLINIEIELRSAIGDLDHKTGTLTIKTPQSVSACILPDIMKSFQLMFPKIGFDIDWCTSYHLADIFHAGTIDLAFLITDTFTDKNLYSESLMPVFPVFAVAADKEHSDMHIMKIHDLEGETLLFAKSECSYKKKLQKMMLESDVRPGKMIEINSLEAIRQLMILGYGIGFLPKMALSNELNSGQLKILNWEGPELVMNLVMIWSKSKPLSEPLQAFIMTVREEIEKNPVLRTV